MKRPATSTGTCSGDHERLIFGSPPMSWDAVDSLENEVPHRPVSRPLMAHREHTNLVRLVRRSDQESGYVSVASASSPSGAFMMPSDIDGGLAEAEEDIPTPVSSQQNLPLSRMSAFVPIQWREPNHGAVRSPSMTKDVATQTADSFIMATCPCCHFQKSEQILLQSSSETSADGPLPLAFLEDETCDLEVQFLDQSSSSSIINNFKSSWPATALEVASRPSTSLFASPTMSERPVAIVRPACITANTPQPRPRGLMPLLQDLQSQSVATVSLVNNSHDGWNDVEIRISRLLSQLAEKFDQR